MLSVALRATNKTLVFSLTFSATATREADARNKTSTDPSFRSTHREGRLASSLFLQNLSAGHPRHCSIDGAPAKARASQIGCLLRNFRKVLCLRRSQVEHNAVILQGEPTRRKSDFTLAEAQHAADIGA